MRGGGAQSGARLPPRRRGGQRPASPRRRQRRCVALGRSGIAFATVTAAGATHDAQRLAVARPFPDRPVSDDLGAVRNIIITDDPSLSAALSGEGCGPVAAASRLNSEPGQ